MPSTYDDYDEDVFDFGADVDEAPRPNVPVEFLTGSAGTGKTFEVMRRIEADPSYGVLCATTGVAAINLGAITLNSTLKYFDTESLLDRFLSGKLATTLDYLGREKRHLIIDEVSMLDARQLDIIYDTIAEVNLRSHLRKRPLGIVLTGDFCQLPPVKSKWAFEAKCWPEFEAHTTRLTKNYRQVDPTFIEALSQARRGDGDIAVRLLAKAGAHYDNALNSNFQGTTIVPKNADVDRYNQIALQRVTGKVIRVKAKREGQQRSEWNWRPTLHAGIPNYMDVKINSLVMILANDTPAFSFVNGDLGYVRDFVDGAFLIELLRNGKIVSVGTVVREVTQRNAPEEVFNDDDDDNNDALSKDATINDALLRDREPRRPNEIPYYNPAIGKWVVGRITYYPLRAGYATTVHKAQGLTLERVQVDCRGHFFGAPNCAYVALSRARTPNGLHIVGPAEVLARRIKPAPEVVRWL